MNFDLNSLLDKGYELLILYVPKFLLALIVLLVGLRIVKLIVKGIMKALDKKDVDPALKGFLGSIIKAILNVVLLISVASMIGIATTSFVAILGAAGLAVGLALQGNLSNFAGGVLIILFKPFKIGDVIQTQGITGVVKKIDIFHSTINTFDNKVIIIPNGPLSNGIITNYSTEKLRRVDFVFGIGYDDDIKKAQSVLKEIVTGHEKVLEEPAPFIRLGELGDSSVNFTVRAWCEGVHYWDVFFDITEQVKLRFDEDGISIPYPQTDVHLFDEK